MARAKVQRRKKAAEAPPTAQKLEKNVENYIFTNVISEFIILVFIKIAEPTPEPDTPEASDNEVENVSKRGLFSRVFLIRTA